jgi:hypothetical protein
MVMRGVFQVQVIAASMALAACGSGPATNPDGNGMMGSDAAPGVGIAVSWTTTSPVPGGFSSNVTIDAAVFRMATFEVIGDAGANNPTTTLFGVEAEWKSATEQPDAIDFPFAPPGVYSKLSAHIDGALVDESLEISGMVQVNGQPKMYKIHDRNDVPVSLDVTGTLGAGSGLSYSINVDFQHALDAVQFDQLDTDDNGVLDLDTFDSQMPAFEHALIEAITSPSTGDH